MALDIGLYHLRLETGPVQPLRPAPFHLQRRVLRPVRALHRRAMYLPLKPGDQSGERWTAVTDLVKTSNGLA